MRVTFEGSRGRGLRLRVMALTVGACSLYVVAAEPELHDIEGCSRPPERMILESVTAETCTYEHGCTLCPSDGPRAEWLVIEEWSTYRDMDGQFLYGDSSDRNRSQFRDRLSKYRDSLESIVTLGYLSGQVEGSSGKAPLRGALDGESMVAVHRAESSLYTLYNRHGRLTLSKIDFDDGLRASVVDLEAICDVSMKHLLPSSPGAYIKYLPTIVKSSIAVEGDACVVKLEYAPSEHIKSKGLEKVIPLTQAQRPLTQAELAKRRLRYEKKGHSGSLILHLSDWKKDGDRHSYELRQIVADESGRPVCVFSNTCRSEQSKSTSTLEESYRKIERSLEMGDFLVKDSEGLLVYPNDKGGATLERYRKGQGLARPVATYWWVDGRLVEAEGADLWGPRSGPKEEIARARFEPLESGKIKLVCETTDGAMADVIVEHE